MHDDAAVVLHVIPELLCQELDVCDGREEEEELAQPPRGGAVRRAHTQGQSIL